MVARIGDYSDKRYLYKVYKRGYSSTKSAYIDTDNGVIPSSETEIINSSDTGSFDSGSFFAQIFTTGSGGNIEGIVTSDPIRMIDIYGVNAVFNRHDFASSPFGSVDYYYVELFDYKVYFDVTNNQVKFYKYGVLLDTQTLSSSYDWIQLRTEPDVDPLANDHFKIDSSSDGVTWTTRIDDEVNPDTDILHSQLALGFSFGVGGSGNAGVFLDHVLITDKAGQFLALEDKVISPLGFTTNINTPASTTTIQLAYSPLEVPSYLTVGNNIEVYANFYDWSPHTKYEPILDENSLPILDENSLPIYGKSFSQEIPETKSNLRFSGYIETIEYNYDNDTISLTLVSHGELLANTLVHGDTTDNSALSQLLDNATLAGVTTSKYQTFKLYKQTKIDSIAMKFGSAAGGAAWYEIRSNAGTLLGDTHILSWSGALGSLAYQLDLKKSLTLEPGTYRLYIVPGTTIDIRYQNTNVYPDGSWTGGAGDVYFNLFTRLSDFNETITGTSDDIVNSAFQFLDENYTLLYKGDVDISSNTISIQSNIDTVLSLIDNANKQMDTGWWWHVDPGTGELRFKAPHTTADHLLVLGRDFVGFKLNKSISNIKNEAVFVGGEVATNAKLTVYQKDTDSISLYKYGLSIESNDKVTRYDSAGLLVNNTIINNNYPRYTTEITVSAALYDIETFRIGDVVRVMNGDQGIISPPLSIASIQYLPDQVTLSLDTAPANINRNVDALRRQLNNQATANATGAV